MKNCGDINETTPSVKLPDKIGIWEYNQEFDPGHYSYQSIDADKANGIGAEVFVCTDGEKVEVLMFEHQWEEGAAESWGIFDTLEGALDALAEHEYPTISHSSGDPIPETELSPNNE